MGHTGARRWWGIAAIWAVAFLLSVVPSSAESQSAPVYAALYDAGPQPPDHEDILSGRFDNNFSEVSLEHLRVGPPGRTFWLRLETSLPSSTAHTDMFEGQWLLVLNRVAVDSVELFIDQGEAGWSTQSESFFNPGAHAPMLGGGFFFRLTHDGVENQRMYLKVVSDARVELSPRIVREGDTLVADRSLSNLFTAIYTTLLVLLVINLILYAALRDSAYLAFVAWGGAATMLILSANGHLYGVMGLDWLGWWGALGIYMFAFLTAAASVRLFRAFTDIGRHSPRLDQYLKWYGWLLLGMAVLCVPNVRGWASWLQIAASLGLALTSVLLCVVSGSAWRAGGGMARVFFLVWSVLTLLVLLRLALSFGLPSAGALSLYGYQVGAAVAAFLFSVALAERVIEFRQQRDRAKLLKEQTDATLRLEQTRRAFIDDSRRILADATAADAEWVVLRRVLVDLVPLIPQQCSAVIVQGHDGMDYMFCEPNEEKAHFGRLLSVRLDALRGICRSRSPMVVKLEDPGDDDVAARTNTFAVVPLPLSRSGWGALLLERSEWEDFTLEELRMAFDFAKMALDTAHEVVSQVSLRREATSDPLTGALNRRAGDAALEAAIKLSIARRMPLALLFIDLDHFKAVNDMHGHAVGDRCLVSVAETIAGQIDGDDYLSRYGGEEFQVILPGRTLPQARQLAERIRVAVAQSRVEYNGLRLTLTVSIGAALRQGDDITIQSLQERADKALYKAKGLGRNCVATLVPTDLSSTGIPGVY